MPSKFVHRMVPGEMAMYALGVFGAFLIIAVLMYYRFCRKDPADALRKRSEGNRPLITGRRYWKFGGGGGSDPSDQLMNDY